MSAVLTRQAFEQSRLLEFFSEKELQLQIGTSRQGWATALLKELVDNSLDACESASIAPVIEVSVEGNTIRVTDNGPGLSRDIIEKALDYSIRVSTNAAYVSPTRGQLGNALKCVWAAPFVINGEQGRVEVESVGIHHDIDVRLDHIRQEPVITHTKSESTVKTGARITLHWDFSARQLLVSGAPDFYRDASRLLAHYASLNPHAIFTFNDETYPRTADIVKWNPSDPTSPHWYTPERLRDLMSRHIARGDDMSVRDFVAQFRGLSGTSKRKAVGELAQLSGCTIQDMVQDGKVSMPAVAALLDAMQEHSIPIKADKLGYVGEAHVRQWMGDSIYPQSFQYKRLTADIEGMPYVVEVATGVFNDHSQVRRILSGANFTPLASNPFAIVGECLSENRCAVYDPCLVWVHVITPRLDFTDRGKSRADLPRGVPVSKAIEATCKFWKAIKRDSDREGRARQRRIDEAVKREKREKLTVKAAAYQVMEAAYLKASNDGTLPANARQIMYAARGEVLRLTGKDKMDDAYFTQTLLPNFMDEHPDLTEGWDVAYDDRGNFIEPHTRRKIPLGTLKVRGYLQSWHDPVVGKGRPTVSASIVDTSGPSGRYRFALFVEKEGFNALLDQAEIAERWDIATFSTKGMSVTAARRLVDRLSDHGVTILVAHDFDKSGFDILTKLFTDTRRYKFRNTPKVVDLGLRMDDIRDMDLEAETVTYDSDKDPREILRQQGATEDELAMLVSGGRAGFWRGQRVELNAMTSQQFLDWLERKLEQAGVKKVIPDVETLRAAFSRARQIARVTRIINDLPDANDAANVPDDLVDQVKNGIKGTARSWEDVIRQLAA